MTPPPPKKRYLIPNVLRWERLLDYLSRPSVITSVLTRGMQKGELIVADVTMEEVVVMRKGQERGMEAVTRS